MGHQKYRSVVVARVGGKLPREDSYAKGTVERRRKLHATLSFVNQSGEVEFGKDVEIYQEFVWRQLPPEREGGEELRAWTGIEVQSLDPALRDCTIVVAAYPYSSDWFDWGDFKPVLNRSRQERLRPLHAPVEQINAMFRSRKAYSTEPLETRPGWLTARLSSPTRTAGLALRNGRHQRREDSDVWCFGVCREFERCREVMRVSRDAVRLLEATEDGTLFNYRTKVGKAPYLGIGATAKSLARDVLDSSIIKALAGRSPMMERTFAWGPRLVMRLAARIFDSAMYNLVKRLKEPGDGRMVALRDMEATVAAPERIRKKSFAEEVEYFGERFRERRPPERFSGQIEEWLAGEDEEDRILACAALAGAHKAGCPLDRRFQGILQAMADDPAGDASVRRAAKIVLELMKQGDPPCG